MTISSRRTMQCCQQREPCCRCKGSLLVLCIISINWPVSRSWPGLFTYHQAGHTTFDYTSPTLISNALLWHVWWLTGDWQGYIIWYVHDLSSHPSKQTSLEWLSKEISQHICGRTILNVHFLSSNSVCDKELSYVQMLCMLSTRWLAIVSQ